MFFDEMKLNDWDLRAEDISAIVLVHNAVNETARKDIKQWHLVGVL